MTRETELCSLVFSFFAQFNAVVFGQILHSHLNQSAYRMFAIALFELAPLAEPMSLLVDS